MKTVLWSIFGYDTFKNSSKSKSTPHWSPSLTHIGVCNTGRVVNRREFTVSLHTRFSVALCRQAIRACWQVHSSGSNSSRSSANEVTRVPVFDCQLFLQNYFLRVFTAWSSGIITRSNRRKIHVFAASSNSLPNFVSDGDLPTPTHACENTLYVLFSFFLSLFI